MSGIAEICKKYCISQLLFLLLIPFFLLLISISVNIVTFIVKRSFIILDRISTFTKKVCSYEM